jgi:hypothetical protein
MRNLNMTSTPSRIGTAAIALAMILGGSAIDASAQSTFTACRVPDVGAIYMIGVAGAPQACLDQSHIEFSWTEGGSTAADGSITTAKLADGAVTSAKIEAGAVTPSSIVYNGIFDFAGDGGNFRTTAGFGGEGDDALIASIESVDFLSPQLRFDGAATGAWWDVGIGPTDNFEIEYEDGTACELDPVAGWTCPAKVGYEIVSQAQLLSAGTFGTIITPPCPAGKVAVGGGAQPLDLGGAESGGIAVQASWPFNVSSWGYWFNNSTGVSYNFTNHTVCVSG